MSITAQLSPNCWCACRLLVSLSSGLCGSHSVAKIFHQFKAFSVFCDFPEDSMPFVVTSWTHRQWTLGTRVSTFCALLWAISEWGSGLDTMNGVFITGQEWCALIMWVKLWSSPSAGGSAIATIGRFGCFRPMLCSLLYLWINTKWCR